MGEVKLTIGDITKMQVDAIVNAANESLLGGGGVDGAIHAAAGPELLAACRLLHGCKTGQAKATSGFRLPAKYVIHTPGPIWRGGGHGEAELLRSSYRSALTLAEERRCAAVAFPSISTGVYRFPLDLAAPIALGTIREFLKSARWVKTVWMVCYREDVYRAYARVLGEMTAR